jgi:hypothetical protein
MTVILPTHQCFDDALEFVENRLKEHPEAANTYLDTLHVVHGVVRFPDDSPEHAGTHFVHAWVEERDELNGRTLVWDAGLLQGQRIWFSVERDEWYEHMRVQRVTHYTLMAACDMNQETGHYGPWDRSYAQMLKAQHG